jgi:hypothetical protein
MCPPPPGHVYACSCRARRARAELTRRLLRLSFAKRSAKRSSHTGTLAWRTSQQAYTHADHRTEAHTAPAAHATYGQSAPTESGTCGRGQLPSAAAWAAFAPASSSAQTTSARPLAAASMRALESLGIVLSTAAPAASRRAPPPRCHAPQQTPVLCRHLDASTSASYRSGSVPAANSAYIAGHTSSPPSFTRQTGP